MLDIDLKNVSFLIMYENKNNILWVGTDRNANFFGDTPVTLGYFDGMQWVTFTNLPFEIINEIDEAPDGAMLISTEKGQYQYQPH